MVSPELEAEFENNARRRLPLAWRALGVVVVAAMALVGSFELVYAGKIMPGVSANGVYLGGLDRDAATARLNEKMLQFHGEALGLVYGGTTLHIPVNSLGVAYDTPRAVAASYQYGRVGGFWEQLQAHGRALLGRATAVDTSSYDDTKLVPYLGGVVDDVVTPVGDATLAFNDNKAQVTPATPGARVDIGALAQAVTAHIATTDADTIIVNQYQLEPLVDTESLRAATGQADSYVSAPITLSSTAVNQIIDQKTIISWLKVNHRPVRTFLDSRNLNDLYPGSAVAGVSLDPAAVAAYVATLTAQSNHEPKNAGLAMVDGKLAVISPSQTGIKLNEAAALADITAAVTTGGSRTVNLKLDIAQAEVREDNLDALGIKELISEGQTFFPGSTVSRLINVRTGAAQFNNVLLKPGQQFSFGELLGSVGPEKGYVPELVILGDHEEKQYGGGLCQVSSTAYRAALLAGLPINERHNHSYAISYYTAPYGVPGVDATIYYPGVDMKFTNDTGSYILIQTHMTGSSLTFDYFGTKTKSGVIRGPEFITGNSDVTKPSHTVFYRDVLDLTGAVMKTDRVDTYYQSSENFPITKQFN